MNFRMVDVCMHKTCLNPLSNTCSTTDSTTNFACTGIYTFFFSYGAAAQRGLWPPHSWDVLDHTQQRTTFGRTPLDEWSARRRDLYLITHNTHNRQTFMPPVGFEPTISAGQRSQTYALDRAATGAGNIYIIDAQNLLLYVSVVRGCLHSGVFTVVEAVLSKWSVVFSSHTLAHVLKFFVKTREQPLVKCNNVKTKLTYLLHGA